MPRGRKPRAVTCQAPPRGVYLVDWTVNILYQKGALSAQALVLWLHLRGLAWQHGECDPTDALLAELMGGIKHDLIRIIRRTLEAHDLLYEYQRDGARWLVPLPVSTDMRGSFAPAMWAGLADRQGRLVERLAELRREPVSERARGAAPGLGQGGNSPPGELGANSFGGQCLKEEEELVNARGDTSPHPLTYTTPVRRAGERGAERGGGGERISPHPNWGPNQMGPNANGGQSGADGRQEEDDDLETLCRFIAGHGVFPSIARSVAEQYLCHMNVQEAQAEVLAWVISIRESKDVREGKIDQETARGRLVTRLREGAAPPMEALDQAWDTLREIWDALDPAEEEDEEQVEDDVPRDDDPAAMENEGQMDGEDEEAPVSELAMPTWNFSMGGREMTVNAEGAWQMVLANLRAQVNKSTYDIYLRPSYCLGVDEEQGTMVVGVGYQFAADWLNHQAGLHNLICRNLRQFWPELRDVRYEER